jgi:hypothetical protein
MTHRVTLTVTSLISIFLVVLHVSDDIVRGFEPGGLKHIQTILTMSGWLYATVALAERRPKYILMLLGSLLGVAVSLAHMRGAGLVGGRIAGSSGMLLWVWTVITLGVTATVSVVLAARGLWSLRRQASPHQSSTNGRD